MKRKIVLIFIVLLIIAFIKYFKSDYKTEYNINGYNVKTIYENKRYYIEIDGKYNFVIYKDKIKLSRLKIKNISTIEGENFKCIYPVINKIKTYPLCYQNDEYIDYNLIESENLAKYKTKQNNYEINDTFSYNSNLDKNEYVFLWNYKGFYKMSYNNKETINIFDEDKYDNSLMYKADNKIIFPDYDEEYVFTSFYVLNIINSKYKKIETKYEISYDSYIVGNIKNKVYLYDIKNDNLYEINLKRLKVELIGSNEIGYYKFENNKKVESDKKEYSNKKISYINSINDDYIVNKNIIYKVYSNNSILKEKIYVGENLKLVNSYENDLYFISKDKFYKYSPLSGVKQIFNYFELNFNDNEIIYIYAE